VKSPVACSRHNHACYIVTSIATGNSFRQSHCKHFVFVYLFITLASTDYKCCRDDKSHTARMSFTPFWFTHAFLPTKILSHTFWFLLTWLHFQHLSLYHNGKSFTICLRRTRVEMLNYCKNMNSWAFCCLPTLIQPLFGSDYAGSRTTLTSLEHRDFYKQCHCYIEDIGSLFQLF